MTYKVGNKVAGTYWQHGSGTVLDYSGIVSWIDAGAVTVTFSKGNRTTYNLPATDFLSPLRTCTGCHKPTILNRCIGNGGCGADTIPAKKD